MDDCGQPVACWCVRKHNGGERPAIQRPVRGNDARPQISDLRKRRGPRGRDLTGQHVRIDYARAPGREKPRYRAFSRTDAACETDPHVREGGVLKAAERRWPTTLQTRVLDLLRSQFLTERAQATALIVGFRRVVRKIRGIERDIGDMLD